MIGLLAEELQGNETLDFNAPRRAPDRYESPRRIALAGLLLGVLAIGGVLTTKSVLMRDLNAERTSLERDVRRAREAYNDYTVEKARLDYVDSWLGADTRVLEHLELLHGLLPNDGAVLLDSVSARAASDVDFVQKKKGKRAYYTDYEWATSRSGVVTVTGRMTDQTHTDALRTRLVSDPAYTLTSGGADTPAKFQWTLRALGPPVTSDQETTTVEKDTGG